MTFLNKSHLLLFQEVEVATGPFFLDASRNKWMDYTSYLVMGGYRILAARGRPEVNPWGFLLPISQFVWGVVLGALLLVTAIIILLSRYIPSDIQKSRNHFMNVHNPFRVLLQQGKLLVSRVV